MKYLTLFLFISLIYVLAQKVSRSSEERREPAKRVSPLEEMEEERRRLAKQRDLLTLRTVQVCSVLISLVFGLSGLCSQ